MSAPDGTAAAPAVLEPPRAGSAEPPRPGSADLAQAGRAELARALGVLLDRPEAAHGPVAAALGLGSPASPEAHAAVLVLQCHPHAAVYLGERGMLGGEAADRVAGFWRAIGVPPPPDADHVGRLLGLYAALADHEASGPGRAAEAAGRARRVLLGEHLASWMPVWLGAVVDAGDAWFERWAVHAQAWLAAELRSAGDGGDRSGATGDCLPAALARAPGGLCVPGGHDAPLDVLLDELTAPVRCGMVLTRSRLSAAARAVGTAPRQGERRFVLRGLLEHDAPGTLAWCAAEARRWQRRFDRWAESDPVCGTWWAGRAGDAASVLDGMATGA